MSDALPPAVTTPDDLANLIEAPGETAQRVLRAGTRPSFLGAIRQLHEQHETARRARASLARRRIAVSGRTERPTALLGEMIAACGATHVGYAEDWDMLVVGVEPSRRALARAAREGIAVIGEGDLAAVHRFVQRHSERVDATSAEALERARAEARQLEAQRRTVPTPRKVQDVAERLADVAQRAPERRHAHGAHQPPPARGVALRPVAVGRDQRLGDDAHRAARAPGSPCGCARTPPAR